jgi:hypothetical protein
MNVPKAVQRGRRNRLRVAPAIGRTIATFITIARPADGDSARPLLAASSSDRVNWVSSEPRSECHSHRDRASRSVGPVQRPI